MKILVAVVATALRTPLIAGNWKMNPSSLEDAARLAASTVSRRGVEVVLFPPAPYAACVASSGVSWGAQDVCALATKGAFTGEVSAPMVASLGAKYVLVGHSERRRVFDEGDDVVAAKLKQALDAGLDVMLCIGETQDERDGRISESVCAVQLVAALKGVDADDMARVVVAYEPVWAIGTGLVCDPAVAQITHSNIRKTLADMYTPAIAAQTRILYGGSVSPSSVDALMDEADIDGVLVGGASLDAASFARIVRFVYKPVLGDKVTRYLSKLAKKYAVLRG